MLRHSQVKLVKATCSRYWNDYNYDKEITGRKVSHINLTWVICNSFRCYQNSPLFCKINEFCNMMSSETTCLIPFSNIITYYMSTQVINPTTVDCIIVLLKLSCSIGTKLLHGYRLNQHIFISEKAVQH